MYVFERERESEHREWREAERERESQADSPLSSEPTRTDFMTLRSWPKPKPRVRHSINWATQAPQTFYFFFLNSVFSQDPKFYHNPVHPASKSTGLAIRGEIKGCEKVHVTEHSWLVEGDRDAQMTCAARPGRGEGDINFIAEKNSEFLSFVEWLQLRKTKHLTIHCNDV